MNFLGRTIICIPSFYHLAPIKYKESTHMLFATGSKPPSCAYFIGHEGTLQAPVEPAYHQS